MILLIKSLKIRISGKCIVRRVFTIYGMRDMLLNKHRQLSEEGKDGDECDMMRRYGVR